ncbi:MAG: Bacterial cell division rane protein [Herbinix sp.]|jgi:rod shape determining protein RodA|nr:Bacterial cell division rane protein [Herbinix sp.]
MGQSKGYEAVKEKRKINFKKIDYIMIITMTILIGIGIYCSRQAFMLSEEQNSIFIKQIAGILIGYVFIVVIALIDYHIISNLSFVLYIAINAVLAVTLVMGSNLNNVNRWIVILGIPFQPSELAKVVLILFLAFLCNSLKNKLDKFYVLFLLVGVVAIPMALIMLEPHLSSALAIFFVFCIMVYCSGIRYRVIGTALAMVLPLVVGLVVAVTLFEVKLPFIEKYQVKRVLSFMSTDESDELAGDYQQNQSIGAIGSGGLQGKLIFSEGDGDKNYSDIYAKESDFVFAIIGEDFGFIGSFIIIILYAILVIRCLIISSHAPDYLGKLICMGVSAYFMFQIFINIGVATMLLPNTGLPLPFISNGLTSLISSMAAVGLVINIGMRQKGKNTDGLFGTLIQE